MAEINAAWRVLSDPGRRAMYDASRRTSPSATVQPRARTDLGVRCRDRSPAPLPPARVPWRLMATMAGIGAAVVIALAVFARPSETPPPDNLIDAGSCVIVEANTDAREVTCPGDVGIMGSGVRVVRELVASVAGVPDGHRCSS